MLKNNRDEISTNLFELQDKYDTEKAAFEQQLRMLTEQIKMSSAGSEDQQAQLQNQIQEATRDRDALIEELRKLREGLQLENEEMLKKNQLLGRKLVDLKKARENVEKDLCAKQELEGQYVNDLRKKLLQHVYDMHNWKVFLEQNKDYDSEGLHIVMEGVLADLSFKEQVITLENAIQEETEILARLTAENKIVPAPSTSESLGSSANPQKAVKSSGHHHTSDSAKKQGSRAKK